MVMKTKMVTDTLRIDPAGKQHRELRLNRELVNPLWFSTWTGNPLSPSCSLIKLRYRVHRARRSGNTPAPAPAPNPFGLSLVGLPCMGDLVYALTQGHPRHCIRVDIVNGEQEARDYLDFHELNPFFQVLMDQQVWIVQTARDCERRRNERMMMHMAFRG
ncbi:MAG: hypothetical protein JWM36_2262 [Hyphomicrobiales bacterium]|nr:hypothetical protein [Hyphomicrobiales bacterium]